MARLDAATRGFRRYYCQLTSTALLVVASAIATGDNHDGGDQLEGVESQPQVESDTELSDPLQILETDAGRVEQADDTPPMIPAVEATEAEARIIQFLTRLQTVERELATLQGRLDEVNHFYQEESHLNRNRFLDLDRRLREIAGSSLSPSDEVSEEDLSSEIGMYRRAMAFLDAENYPEAQQFFEDILDSYPNGEKVPDAMYWLAEINRNVEPKNLESARQYFVQMLTLYSDHARVPEVLAKLGMIYHDLGNLDRALEYLDRVIAEFPDHDAARLASTYAAELR